MRMKIRAWWLCCFALSAWPTGILAGATAEKGQGGIVVSAEATVNGNANGTDPQCTLKRGDAVTGMGTGMNSSTNALFGGKMNFFLEEKNGYAHVGYFCPGKDKHNHAGWMRPADLSQFLYEPCNGVNAMPFINHTSYNTWNPCFERARDEQLEKLRAIWAQEDSAKAQPAAPAPPQ